MDKSMPQRPETNGPRVHPHLPAVQCKPWCRYHDGHPDEITQADQACYSTDQTLAPLARPYVVPRTGTPELDEFAGQAEPDGYDVALYQEPGRATEVLLHHHGSDTDVYLTHEEAIELASLLVSAAAKADAR